MKIWQAFLLTGILTACQANPVQLPSWDIETAEITVQKPIPLPVLPQAGLFGQLATFDKAAMEQLQRYTVTSKGNYQIALANAEALESQARAYNSLIEAGKMQRQIAEIRQQLYDEEKQRHFVDNLWHRGIIVLGLIAAVAL